MRVNSLAPICGYSFYGCCYYPAMNHDCSTYKLSHFRNKKIIRLDSLCTFKASSPCPGLDHIFIRLGPARSSYLHLRGTLPHWKSMWQIPGH